MDSTRTSLTASSSARLTAAVRLGAGFLVLFFFAGMARKDSRLAARSSAYRGALGARRVQTAGPLDTPRGSMIRWAREATYRGAVMIMNTHTCLRLCGALSLSALLSG